MPSLEKKFTLSHTIDLSSVTSVSKSTETETHFSIPWHMYYFKSNNRFTFGVLCLYTKSDEWEIQTKIKFRLNSPDGTVLQVKTQKSLKSSKDNDKLSLRWIEFIEMESIEKSYSENGKFRIEVQLRIRKMNGFGTEKLRCFDESSQKHWDVILNVEGHKFHLLKAYLTSQSTYFDKLLFGSFKESSQEEIELKEVDHEDFQSFLELIHGEPAVNDSNIDGVLHLSDMFDAPTAIRRCEEFLLKESKWSFDEKMKLAERYYLKDLMKSLQQSSKGEKKEEVEEVVAKPVKKLSKSAWFSCIRKQRD